MLPPETPAGKPLRRDAERNRKRILGSAAQLFAADGLDVSLEQIARHAEVGVGTVYRHFPTRDALVRVLFSEEIDLVCESAETGLQADDPWTGFTGHLAGTSERRAQDRGVADLLAGHPTLLEELQGSGDRIVPLVAELVARAQADGSLRPDFATSDLVFIQFMLSAVARYAEPAGPDVWHRCLTFVLDGLRASRAEPTPMEAEATDGDGVRRAMASWAG